jgi:hypothetical protein
MRNSYTGSIMLVHPIYRDSAIFNVPYSVLINDNVKVFFLFM